MATRTPTSFATSTNTSSTRYGHRYGHETTTTTIPVAPLTTPFPAPANCFDDFHLANYSISTLDLTDVFSNATMLNANTTGIYSSKCWPSGFRTTKFNPGVCPSGWTYYNIRTGDGGDWVTVSNTSTYEVRTSADCCVSGFSKTERKDFTKTWAIDGCYQEVKDGHTTLDGLINGTATVQFTGGYLRHEPFRIEWAESDAGTLSPSPPQLSFNSYVPTWVPGTKANLHKSQDLESDGEARRRGPLLRFMQIGVPIIIVFLIGCCCTCCVWYGRNRKREKRRMHDQQVLREAARRAEAETNIAAVEAVLAAEAHGDAELAQAIELIERQQTEETATSITASPTAATTTGPTASPPRYSIDNADDVPPPAYQQKTSMN